MRQASRRKFHYVYRIIRDDGWYYYGIHSTDDLEDEYFGSGSDLWRSIHYHGKEKHSKEILEFTPDRDSARLREKELVGDKWKEDPICLNKMPGGQGGFEHIFNDSRFKEWQSTAGKISQSRMTTKERKRRRSLQVISEDTCEKIRVIARKFRWVMKDGCHQKIAKDDLEGFLKDGWTQGKLQNGEKRIWISNGSGTRKCLLSELGKMLEDGWKKGRIFSV